MFFCIALGKFFAYNFVTHKFESVNKRTQKQMVKAILAESGVDVYTSGVGSYALSAISDAVRQVKTIVETPGIIVFTNGKSVLLELLNFLFPELVSHTPLAKCNQRFGTAELMNKVLNISSEERAEICHTEEIKAISAGDTVSVEQKFKDRVSVRITAKLLVATNNLPVFTDRSKGWEERFVIIPFQKTYVFSDDPEIQVKGERPNPMLIKELEAECEGIAYLLLERLQSMKNRGWELTKSKKAEKQEIDVLKFSGKRAFREEFIRILEYYGCNTKIVENNSREHYKNIKVKKSFVDKMYC